MAPKLFSFGKRSIILLFCLVFPSALLPGLVKAQMGGVDPDPSSPGSGGQSTIQGRIHYPSGRAMDKRLRVRLTGLRIGDFFTIADDSGAFSFRRLAIGSYVISVEAGKEYEPVNEMVDINQFSRSYSLQIQLRLKRTSANEKSKVIDAALAGVPKPAVDLYETALATARGGDTKKAIEQLKEALSLHPNFLLALNELGIQYWKTGQLDKAAGVFRSAVKLSSDEFSLRLNYGIVLVHLKRYKEAEPELRRAAQVNDGSALAHYYLGRVLANSQRYDEAEKELLQALRIGGDEANSAHRYLGAIYNERGDTKRALKELETYLKLVPSAKDAEQIREIIRDLKNQK